MSEHQAQSFEAAYARSVFRNLTFDLARKWPSHPMLPDALKKIAAAQEAVTAMLPQTMTLQQIGVASAIFNEERAA